MSARPVAPSSAGALHTNIICLGVVVVEAAKSVVTAGAAKSQFVLLPALTLGAVVCMSAPSEAFESCTAIFSSVWLEPLNLKYHVALFVLERRFKFWNSTMFVTYCVVAAVKCNVVLAVNARRP